MAATADLAPNRTRKTSSNSGASRKSREEHLEDQISRLQDDLKAITATLARLSGEKVAEARSTAKAEVNNLVKSGQHAIDEVTDQAGEFEKQIKDTIRERPLTAVASAIGIGYVLALLSRH